MYRTPANSDIEQSILVAIGNNPQPAAGVSASAAFTPAKGKPMKTYGNPDHNPYYQSDIRDAIRTRKWLAGEDMSKEAKWIVREKNIPCAWYAISVLAPENGMTCLFRTATKSKFDGYWNAYAIVKKGHGKLASTRIGASHFHDKQMALAFACRNAIKWLLPQAPTGERMAYRDTQDNALERYA